MEETRIVEMGNLPGDSWQYSLRPHYLKEYIGQEKAKRNLEVFIAAAKMRKEALDHVLWQGLLLTKRVSVFVLRRDRLLSEPEIWRHY